MHRFFPRKHGAVWHTWTFFCTFGCLGRAKVMLIWAFICTICDFVVLKWSLISAIMRWKIWLKWRHRFTFLAFFIRNCRVNYKKRTTFFVVENIFSCSVCVFVCPTLWRGVQLDCSRLDGRFECEFDPVLSRCVSILVLCQLGAKSPFLFTRPHWPPSNHKLSKAELLFKARLRDICH